MFTLIQKVDVPLIDDNIIIAVCLYILIKEEKNLTCWMSAHTEPFLTWMTLRLLYRDYPKSNQGFNKKRLTGVFLSFCLFYAADWHKFSWRGKKRLRSRQNIFHWVTLKPSALRSKSTPRQAGADHNGFSQH